LLASTVIHRCSEWPPSASAAVSGRIVANFETAPVPRCDVVTAAFSLHHIAAPAAKRKVFAKVFRALRPGGLLVTADCATASSRRLQTRDMAGWRDHLAARLGRRAGATKLLKAWAAEGRGAALR
jgi:predicted methyltransferase